MNNFSKFIKKYLLSYTFILIGIVLFNIFIYFISYRTNVADFQNNSPDIILKELSDNLHADNESYTLTDNYMTSLKENNRWAILIDKDGSVIGRFNSPKEISLSYSIQDVANFSKDYLYDYPVFSVNFEDKLLVLAYPKDSIFKFRSNYIPMVAVKKLPVVLLVMFFSNIGILFFAYYFSKRKIVNKIAPIINSINSLSKGEEVSLNINGELKDIANQINQTSICLKSQNQARSNWISGVSHDIRTPLSMIVGYADNISSNSNNDEKTKKQAEIIKSQSIKIKSLIQDLNIINELNYNSKMVNISEIYLAKLLREIVAEYLNETLNSKYEFDINIAKDCEKISIKADKRLIIHMIQNIISNSINHNENGCRINVSLNKKYDDLVLCIRDNGKGISNDKLNEIKAKSHYMNSTDNKFNLRHGLGLILVKEVVSIHNGSITIDSQENKGFSTIISFPIHKSI